MSARLVRFSLEHRGPVLVLAALLVLALSTSLFSLKSDNRSEVFFPADNERLLTYETAREIFGPEQDLRIVLTGPGLFGDDSLRWQRDVEVSAKAMPGVIEAMGLPAHHEPTLERWPPSNANAFVRSLGQGHLDEQQGLVSADRETVTLLLTLAKLSPEAELALLRDLEQLCLEAPDGVSATLSGLPVLARALDRSTREVMARFLPLLVLTALGLLFLALADWRCVLATMLFVGGFEATLLGLMARVGLRLNLVLAVLPPVLFVIALATTVHVVMGARAARSKGLSCRDSVLRAFEERSWAVVLTGLTTGIGFASLLTADVPPVRMLGACASLGVALLTLAVFTVLPALLVPALSTVKQGVFERTSAKRGRRLASFAQRHRRLILLGAITLAFASLAAAPGLRVESNALTYLPPDHPVRQGFEHLEDQGIGLASVELLLALEPGGGLGLADLDGLARLSELSSTLNAFPSVLGVVSAGCVVDDAALRLAEGDALEAPEWRPDVWDEINDSAPLREGLDTLLTRDGQRARLIVLTRLGGIPELDPLIDSLLSSARRSFPEARVEVTGEYPLLLEAQRRLLGTMGSSFGLSLLGISLVMMVLLRRPRLVLAALAANLLPPLVVLGTMGCLAVPVDIATVMVASVVLGLAVDDTLHALGHHRRLLKSGNEDQALPETLAQVAGAQVLTALILVLGFGACTLSDFAPTLRFGALAALGVSVALLGDLLVLPALLSRASKDDAPS